MAKTSATSHVAYIEEANEDGEPIGTEPRYAKSTAAESSPSKEKPNTSRSRKDSHRRRESPSPSTSPSPSPDLSDSHSDSDSDNTEHPLPPRRTPKPKMKDEKKRRSSLVVQKGQRPPARSHKTAPAPSSRASDESSYYGVQQTVASSSRPRARTRPESYHQPAQRPPLSTSAYSHQPPHPSQFPVPSFPPHGSWGGPPPMPLPMPHQQPGPPPPFHEYGNRDLASRFGQQRPQSAIGYHQASRSHDYEQPPKEKALARRTSVSRKISKDHEDRMRMPPPPHPHPPPRPASARPTQERLVLRPGPPPASRRKSVGFEDDDFSEADSSMYHAVGRREVEYGSGALPIRTRPGSYADTLYDEGPYALEPASRGRRNSLYNLDERVREVSQYQDDVNGGPTPPLTAEALRRVKNGGSSRSTRSSESRDESDYKHSATTRTTRSGSGDDDITIKVPAGAVIEVGNTKIHCNDGGDMNIGRGGGTTRAGGSDRETIYSDERHDRNDRNDRNDRIERIERNERKSRADRLLDRSASQRRASSQAPSYPRAHAPPLYPPPYRYGPHYDHDFDASLYGERRYAPPLAYDSPDENYI
ncbi:hypothetical protein F5B20DRAFT_172015 [Whalleya microplaca]|nr:hypothetical protein F5B20DRAFT_172015 [Whalleya microplaca]